MEDISLSTTPQRFYYNEGHSGNNKYTFEVFREPDGGYRAVSARWNRRLDLVNEQTHYTSSTKEGLRDQDYPRTRQVKIFLDSDFWDASHV
ncbi:sugar ABC transporter substrate-binding protein [Serratia sp. M24T3]|uniref:sugar ABC transporter substrate-binding protein n=1 Tax=Serratia sp. M24T3 TaxID=932213 RepID=UPI000906EC00|nr:sugar ABC transporter substrate-binding protein [Serratia sp. M24T3]